MLLRSALLLLLTFFAPACLFAQAEDAVLAEIQEELSYGIGPAGVLESDPRNLPWPTLRRLALEAGAFLPPYQPVSGGEIAESLVAGLQSGAEAYEDPGEAALLAFWLPRLAMGRGAATWYGCDCKENPPNLRLNGGAELMQSSLGDAVANAAARQAAAGLVAALELEADFWAGRWWAGLSGRLMGRIAANGRAAPAALTYADWPVATGRPPAGWSRTSSGVWRGDLPRAVGGVRLGNWSVTAGWSPRLVGPSRSGGLSFSSQAASIPALTVRRTRPFQWHGVVGWLDPDHLLLRCGVMSEQEIRWRDEGGDRVRGARPWHFQWLISWNHTSWLRTTLNHAAMAAAGEGSLWSDLFQINFPLLSGADPASEGSPVTHQIISLLFEARFRRAPWPLLPAAAGRVYWEYGGENYGESDFLPFIPQITAPASLVGVELVEPRWDLTVEYAWLRDAEELWYANPGFAEGYTEEGWLLGHALGGGGAAWSGALRWRPSRSPWQLELSGKHATWTVAQGRGEEARRDGVELGWRRLARTPALWLGIGWREEEVVPAAGVAATTEEWWLVRLGLDF